MPRFTELCVTTNFSFLRGASHPEELVAQAITLGLSGIGVADRNSVAGVVRAHVFLRENREKAPDFRMVSGCRLVLTDGTPDLVVYPRDRAAWGRLCRLLTRGKMRAEKGDCRLALDDVLEHAEGQQFILLEQASREDVAIEDVARGKRELPKIITRLREAAGGRVWIGLRRGYDGEMRDALATRATLARRLRLPLIATNDVTLHGPERRRMADVLACIRTGTTLETAGTRLDANAERHIKPPHEMARIFADVPEAITETQRFLDGIAFSLDDLRYDYPDELREGYATTQEALEAFTFEGAKRRYPHGVSEKIVSILRHELDLVAQMNYAPYFLTVHDIVRYARDRGILCQGRGSAANSSVCFCLGITEVDPTTHDLLFERFISPDRNEPPDIDVDFEHERREEVMQYIYDRFGRDRAALTASVITYRTRSTVRDVGKVFGFSEDTISALSGTVWGWSSGKLDDEQVRKLGFDPADTVLSSAMDLAGELAGFPRHLSQHSGGFVITRSRLDEVVPVGPAAMENRTTIEWDKDDLDALGILKIDVLALGMLSCLRKALDLLEEHYDEPLMLSTIPAEEPCVYDMISRADTIGVFQIESRAQMSMLPRLKPNKFYDLVIEVAIVRPGPIQGDMVHPYLRRRQRFEKVSYPSPELEGVLGKTLGVPLFQEQAMKIAIVAAGFTPAEADKLRRAMATFKRVGTIHTFYDKMVRGMTERGYPPDFAERCFKQIEGFGTYGFPESHAASFALLVYASAWIKCRYPDVFAAALLNAQPMGFYAPSQIVRDAREHGTEVRDVDINFSDWNCTLEDLAPDSVFAVHRRHADQIPHIRSRKALRLGFRQVNGLREGDMKLLVARRERGYDSVRDLWLRTGLSIDMLEKLAGADAFRSLGLDRRDALWAVRGLRRAGDKDDLPLFRGGDPREREPDARLPPMPLGEHVVEDYRHLSLSLKAHPVAFVRNRLAEKGILRSEELAGVPVRHGRYLDKSILPRVSVAGLVLVRQRPGSAAGVIFMTLEDETGVANIIVWPKVFEAQRALVIGARFVRVTGRLQNESGVVHVVAEHFEDLTQMMGLLSTHGRDVSSLARADEVRRPQVREKAQHPRNVMPLPLPLPERPVQAAPPLRQVLPKGRNFH